MKSAALAVVPPLTFDEWDDSMTVEGYVAKPGEDVSAWVNHISPDFFATLKIPIYAGRDFTDQDRRTGAKVAIVNEKFARRYFGQQSPIGKHVGIGSDPGPKSDLEIMGLVRDTKYQTMREEPPKQVYFPYLQNDWATGMTAYVRSDVDSATMFPALRAAVHRIGPSMPVYQMKRRSDRWKTCCARRCCWWALGCCLDCPRLLP